MEENESLSASEQAYFESRGEAEVKDTPQPEAAAETTPEVIDPETADIEAAEIEQPQPEGEEKPRVQKVVPLTALTKERQAKKELTARLSEAERKAAILEDRWNMILSQQGQPAQPEQQQPQRPTDDPFALINYVADKLDSQEKTAAEQRKAAEAQAQMEARRNVVAQQEQAFRATKPDYDTALAFVAQSRDKELATIYPLSTPEQRQQVILQEWEQIVNTSAQTRHNPAELIYNLATSRGYTPAAPEEKKPDPAALDKLAENIDGSASLSEASGGAPTTLSAQAIADMSPDEFAAWYAKPGNEAKFRRLAGGR